MLVLERTARVVGAVVLGAGLAYAALPALLTDLARPVVAAVLGTTG